MEKKVVVTILAVLVMVWLGPTGKLAAERPEDAGTGNKPDKLKPVSATDVELVKKVSLKDTGWGKGGKGGRPAKKAGVATGILGEAVGGERYAVVVGISDYPGTANDLNYGDDDAIDMADALENVYGFTNVTLLTDLAATRKAILEAIDAIPADAGEIVFFFSGHGMKGIADDGDAERVDEAIVVDSNDLTALVPIWDGELKGAFAGFTGRIVFVFDSCLAGGMKSDLAGPDRVIAMACTESGLSYEGGKWPHGEFTYYFVDDGIMGGLANIHDYDGNHFVGEPNQVTAEEAYDYAKANCTADNPTVLDSFEDDLLP
jgi:hypothetical protein